MIYSYQFNGGKKPSRTIVSDVVPDGFITFNGGAAVDWTKFDYDGVQLVAVEKPVIPEPTPYVPTSEELKQQHNAPILMEISQLETKQHRAVREHIMGDSTAVQRVTEINSQIANLRSQLQ